MEAICAGLAIGVNPLGAMPELDEARGQEFPRNDPSCYWRIRPRWWRRR